MFEIIISVLVGILFILFFRLWIMTEKYDSGIKFVKNCINETDTRVDRFYDAFTTCSSNNKKNIKKLEHKIRKLELKLNHEIEVAEPEIVKCDKCKKLIRPEDAKRVRVFIGLNTSATLNSDYPNSKYYCPKHIPDYDIEEHSDGKIKYYRNEVEVTKNGKVK